MAHPASVAAAAREVHEHVGRLDVLVNNAGADYDEDRLPSTVDGFFRDRRPIPW